MSIKSTIATVGIIAGIAGALFYFRKPILDSINNAVAGFFSGAPGLGANLPIGSGGAPTPEQVERKVEKIAGAQSELDQIQSEALVSHEAQIKALQESAYRPDVFNRKKENVRVFTLSKPVKAPKTGLILENFAYFTTPSKSREEKKERQEASRQAVTSAGFSLGINKYGQIATPIHTLISSPSRIDQYKQQLEASQLRRLGLRQVPGYSQPAYAPKQESYQVTGASAGELIVKAPPKKKSNAFQTRRSRY